MIRVGIDEERKDQFVVLKEKEGSRKLPIAIGINEAFAIRLKLNNIASPRPPTHDLICRILEKLELGLSRVVIDDLIEGVFYAKLHLSGCKPAIIDARPSDGIALALRTCSPIFVEEKVFSKQLKP